MDSQKMKSKRLAIATLCRVGDIGGANSQWNQWLLEYGELVAAERGDFTQLMGKLLNCQEREDWIGFADVLEFEWE